MSDPVYLDYNATTPVAPQVLDAMLPWLRNEYGNPSSAHPYGRSAAQAVATARREVAELIAAQPHEIVFTGCATEANNLALLGVAQALGPSRRHIVVSSIEHPAVMAPAMVLREQGWEVTVLPVDGFGRVSLDQFERELRPDTALVSVMHANNEVGTLQPIAEIARLTRPRGILLHTDAAQSAGKVRLDVDELDVDLLTLAGHKFYAPKGVGALYVRSGTPIRAVLHGANQEHGLRPGTENVAAIVALGAAAALALGSLEGVAAHLRAMRDRLHASLDAGIAGLVLNGHPDHRLPNTLHVSFPGVSGRALLAAAADAVAASVGSACHSEHDQVSGVLAAMGVDAARASGAVRMSVGRMTTSAQIDRAAAALLAAWRAARGT
jgi:cysteine desulfurase